jgi:hypothetical protein
VILVVWSLKAETFLMASSRDFGFSGTDHVLVICSTYFL